MSEDQNDQVQEQAIADPAMHEAANIDVVKGINVTLSMELGRTRLSIGELLELNQGSVIELNRMVDEHLDVLVNGTLVAHGEVVVIDDKFGLRLTDIVNPVERVNKIDS